MPRPITITNRRALLLDAVAILERDYATTLEVNEVAHRIATSRRQLQRCFTEHADGSFRACLTRIRMERAAELLETTDLTVREIAGRVGYSQPAQFAKAFARHHGTVPTEFRMRLRPALAA